MSAADGFAESFPIGDRREAGASQADYGPGLRALRPGKQKQGFGQRFRKAIWNQPLGSDAQNRLVDGEAARCLRFHLFGLHSRVHDDNLHRIKQQPLQRQPIAAGVEAEVLYDAAKGG